MRCIRSRCFSNAHSEPDGAVFAPAEGHPGFELMEVEAVSLPIKPTNYFPDEEESSSEVSAEPTPEPTPMPWPNQFRIRWQAGECQIMLQLPPNALDAFWENVDELLTPVQALPPESRPEQSQLAETVPSVAAEE